MDDINDVGLDGALRWVAENRVSGALEITGETASASLFFHQGQACFALLDGEACVPPAGGGIDSDTWLDALASPIADIDFAAALMMAGASAQRVSAFAHQSLDRAIAKLRACDGLRIHHVRRRSPLGTVFRFEVSSWIEPHPDRHHCRLQSVRG